MKTLSRSTRRQGGFTLIEMSVTMAAAGLLFAAVATGQELIDQAKSTKLLNDVKSVEMQIQRFASAKGRMPGDCDGDGVIDYNAGANTRTDVNNKDRADKYSYSVLLPTIPTAGGEALNQENVCADNASNTGATNSTIAPSTTNANVWINELKLAGIISDSVPNRLFAKLVNEDFMFVGNVTDNGGLTAGTSTATGAGYNAIVIHDVPQWMARRLSTSINGQDARADRSRLRMLDRTTSTNGTYTTTWASVTSGASTKNVRDGMTTVVYFFDRVPETAGKAL
jgi:prepilin-type N-terminal cleavage/methylation domain-containing protein